MFIDCSNRIFDCSIRVSRSFANRWQGTANIWEGLGPARQAFSLPHCLKLLYLMFHTFQLFQFSIILVLCLYTAYNSGIILAKIVTYNSSNYAGILGASLVLIP